MAITGGHLAVDGCPGFVCSVVITTKNELYCEKCSEKCLSLAINALNDQFFDDLPDFNLLLRLWSSVTHQRSKGQQLLSILDVYNETIRRLAKNLKILYDFCLLFLSFCERIFDETNRRIFT